MAKPARFSPKQTDKGWCLNIPAKFSQSGKRERYYYRTRNLADAAAKDLKEKRSEFGQQARAIGPTLAEQATAAAILLEPFGLTVLEAAQRVVEIERGKLASSTIEAALESFTAAKDGKSDSLTRGYRYMADALRSDFPERMLSTITAEEILTHVQAKTAGPAAYNLRARLLSAFWRWCSKKPREWCATSPVSHFEKKGSSKGEVGTLTAKQAKALMRAAEKYFPDCVPAFAIALFTGLRQAELDRLQPGDVTAEGITVSAASAKTGRRRFIHMPPTLAAWLRAHPISDSVVPPNWERKERAVRRLAGFRVWSDLVEPNEPPADLPPWPNNALRHTAATTALAIGKPIEILVFEHGHSGGLNTLRNHYVGRMPKKEALAIIAIGPHGKTIPHIQAA